ncbi:MAG: amidohydrolase family protein [Janthinobacterium lividum]
MRDKETMVSFLRAQSGRTSPANAVTYLATASSLAVMLIMQSIAVQAQQPAELVIHNGLIINDTGRMAADIRIRGDKIVEIAPKIVAAPGAREIDASNKFLMPGIIDTHTHLPLDPTIAPPAKGNQDNIVTGGRAALAGGVTLLGDFIALKNDEDPNVYADRNIALIRKNSIADVYIHASVNPVDVPKGSPPDPLTQRKTFEALAARGIVSTGEDFMAREAYDKNSLAWMKLFRVSGEAGVVSMIHAEDYSILTDAQQRLTSENEGTGLTLKNFAQAAPIIAEVLAVQRSVAIAEATGSPIFILHTTSGRALAVIEDAQRRGLLVYAETRPWNLFGTEQGYQKPDGGIYVGGPPLRPKWDQDALWEGIRKGTIDTIGTDHTAFSKEAKLDPTQNINDKRMGQNTLQDYPPMMFSEGVMKDRITLEQMVAVTSTNAAKIFGMYPRKGVIAVGSDADIVIWDPAKKKILKDSDQLSKAGYSTYAGKEVTGLPITTIRRGEIVWDNGKILGQPGSGQFIPGGKFQRPTLRPLSD